MWEVLVRTPLGRLSVRKFIVLLATLAVVSFGYLFATAPVAFAAGEATWKDGQIIYNKHTYEGPVQSVEDDPSGLKAETTYYSYKETPEKGFIIYFTPGTDPPTAKKATLVSANFDDGKPISTANPREITIKPDEGAGQGGGTTSCAVEGIGWVICPVSNFIAKGMDLIYGYIQDFLEVRPLSTSQNQAMYRAWSVMRDFANVAFTIGFLILIYGQISGGLLSNYTIKKMLPRIIIAAILVNVSYWICAIAVDIFNVLGYAIQDLFISIRNSLVGKEGNSWDLISWESFSSLILSGGSAAAGIGIASYLGITGATQSIAGSGALSGLSTLLVPVLLGLLFIVLITFLILAARQAIITILIILSPLAFTAYLLPNTEKFFDKWRSALFTLLLVYPAFSVVYGGSQLAASIIIQNADNINVVLLAMAVQIAPLAITPLLLKLGGGVLNRFANIVNDPTKGVFDRGKNWAKERDSQHKAAGAAKLAERAKLNNFVNGRPKKSERASRGGRFIENSRNRINPYNMAYARDYNRRDREGMKAANEAMTEGYFTQTDAGRRIYERNQHAGFEKHKGENDNKEAWTKRVYGDPTAIRGTAARNGDHYLHSLHEDAHLAEGRAKVIEEAANASVERKLQEQIRDTKGYRDLRVKATVESGLADSAKKVVDAQGSLALKKAIEQNPDLTSQVAQTIRFEKQAAEYDTIVQKSAEAAYDNYSRTDAGAQSLRLRAVDASDKAKLAEQQFNQLVADAKDRGSSANGIALQNVNLASSLQQTAVDTIRSEKATASINSRLQSNAEAIFINSSEGRQLNIANQAATDTLEAAKAQEAATIQEWRTKEGADGLVGDEAALAERLRDADIQKRAQTQRSTAASGIADQEYAGQVRDDAVLPGGTETVAEVAGGIAGAAGISQAKARATQTIFKAFDESVSAEKTLVSRNTPADVLKADIPNPSDPDGPTSIGLGSPNILDEPEERIAALAGKVAAGRHHESQIKLWERMGQLGRQANDELEAAQQSGDQAAIDRAKERVGKVKSLEQQVFGDKAKVPFGAGDSDLGAASVGKYSGNIYASTRARLDTHMSAGQLAGMDPDDIRLIFEMARAGKLSDSQVANVRQAYTAWQEDDNLKATLQPKHRTLLEPINQGTYPDPGDYPNNSDERFFWTNKYQSGLDSI